ncbi:MAG: hypothetical protein CMJ55_04770 [Planctomycetaceae bacterium]|nr:hypothetical protein [Planctomycetaceae bacterium]
MEKPKNMKLPVTGSVSLTQQPYRLKGDERLKIKFFFGVGPIRPRSKRMYLYASSICQFPVGTSGFWSLLLRLLTTSAIDRSNYFSRI